MNDAVSSLRRKLDVLIGKYNKTRTTVVNRSAIREQTRKVVIEYFTQYRPGLFQQCKNELSFQPLDASMQKLIAYCNARTSKTKYLEELKAAKNGLATLEIECLRAASDTPAIGQTTLSQQDTAIMQTLNDLCLTACKSYQQGLHDLSDQKRRSWRGTVTELREALRETLNQMAPDDDVKAQAGFKLEQDRKGPTMKQKVVFILKNREAASNEIKTTKSHVDLIEEKTGAFIRSVYDRSSASTHGAPTRDEAISIKNHIALILSELLQVRG